MTGGEIAALIAAIAFVVLVVFVVRLLMQVKQNDDQSGQNSGRSQYHDSSHHPRRRYPFKRSGGIVG